MKRHSSYGRGFTLIELLVTVALVAILMAVAAPSFTSFQRNAELTSFTNSIIAAINSARGEAMKRGRYAMAVPADGTNWSSGWKVFVDVDRSQTYEVANDILVLSREAPPSYLTITANGSAADSPPYMMFDASGYSKKKDGSFGALTFSVARNDVGSGSTASETRRVIISSTGRVRSCKPSVDSTCTSSASQ
ncbi:GspH/FimT family pseudopilin [Polaromonas sp. UC242_47]|uniref:GspH/FimT family pseudopilin n=1 Tax=Polaromonas sp. UC242_47 TaxID=3374626 RepID=UPI003796DD5F